MSSNETNDTDGIPLPGQPKIRLEVREFGPVAEADVELRPLTVFVGPSNTGKTYLSILIYALHRMSEGFPRLPLPAPNFRYTAFDFATRRGWKPLKMSKKVVREILDKLKTKRRHIRLSDLPAVVHKELEALVGNPDLFGADLATELRRCFDIESESELIRQPSPSSARVSLGISDLEGDLWRFSMESSPNGISVNGHVEDIVILRSHQGPNDRARARMFQRLRSLGRSEFIHPFEWRDFVESLINPDDAEHRRTRDTFYLPAVRGGIMQSHRVIASALVARSTRAGFERIPQIPTFSGGVADFMQRLILYDEDETGSNTIAEMAAALENETLSGEILTTRPAPGGYPEFVYRPQDTQQDIRLTRASSMVSELAPVVLFMRGIVSPGDMFIIEEPEAHLHPAAQTQMAMMLARLVRAGVRVVVTTHSDWLLQEIANLMREGEMRRTREDSSDPDFRDAWLEPREVGIWLFSRKPGADGSTVEEIPFDRIDGVEPKDYEEVAEALYNRSAELQNRLAEAERNEGV